MPFIRIPSKSIFDKYWCQDGKRGSSDIGYTDSLGKWVFETDFFNSMENTIVEYEICSESHWDYTIVSCELKKLNNHWKLTQEFVDFCNRYSKKEVLNKNLKRRE